MKKKFNSSQILKSSEDCNKFSKSVSYETLVGGTATIGREYKQTRRLFLSSANKPLSAVGTLTSLLCNSAKVKALSFLRLRGASGAQGISTTASCRKAHKRRFLFNLIRRSLEKFFKKNFRDDSFCFGFAKILALALIFTIATISESSAEDTAPTIVGRGNCGASCIYTLDSAGTLTLYGEGDMTDYDYSMFGDGFRWNDGNDLSPGSKYRYNIKSIVFAEGSNITSIGNGAFIAAGVSDGITIPDSVTKIGTHSLQLSGLTELTIPESVTSIGDSAFWSAENLTSINIPESVTNMGFQVFRSTPMLSEILIPDTIDTSRWNAQVFYGLSPDTEIVCLGDEEKCKQKLAKYIPIDKGGTCTNYCINKEIQPAQSSTQCNGSYIYENGKCHKRNENQCNATGDYYYNGATCLYRPRNRQVACVNPNYKANDGYCDRLRYTPAEAAEVLNDDNTNSVTITFRK